MLIPANPFRAALRSGRPLIGCWLGLADATAAEIAGTAGFDWLVIDGEHAPNDLRSTLAQLQALQGSAAAPVVRLPVGETWMIKQVLDIGAQTLLIPMVESAAQATALVRATRYPPQGVRGVGAAFARASRYSAIDDYLARADEEVCLLVQVESRAGIAALDAMLAIDGVEGILIGPSDLAADMGHRGQPGAPEVREVIGGALRRIRAAGRAAGILALDPTEARGWMEAGANFVAVGSDVLLLAQGMRALAAGFR